MHISFQTDLQRAYLQFLVLPMRKLFSIISSMNSFLLDSIKNLSQTKRVVQIKSLQFLLILLYRWRLLITHIFVVTVRFLLWPLCWQALVQFSPIKEWTEKTLTDIKVKLENKITLEKKFLGSLLRIPQNPISRHSCKFMELWPGHIYVKHSEWNLQQLTEQINKPTEQWHCSSTY